MKSSKPASQAECGVWLDTVQLKDKAKQKRLGRPISKLLNPLAGGGGYSLAVALNFTQTKIQMPKTKQSTISTFFTTQRRVLNKLSSSDEPNTDPVDSSSSSASTTPSPLVSGTKRKLIMDPEVSDLYETEYRHVKTALIDLGGASAGHERKRDDVTQNEVLPLLEYCESSHTPPLNTDHGAEGEQFEEVTSPPERKRRRTGTSSLPLETAPLGQECSRDPLIACSSPPYSRELNDPGEMKLYDHIAHDSERDFDPNPNRATAKTVSDFEPAFLESLQSEEGFGIWLGVKGRTSTQKCFHHHSPQMDDEKENGGSSSSKSLNKRPSLSPLRPLSNRKWTEQTQRQWEKAEPNSSPLKTYVPRQPCRAVDEEDNLAMLFTQDSEGFRVIAHRGLQAKSPLDDHFSMGMGKRTGVYKSLVEDEEEEEMLFTQDSQGNMVIKH